MKDTHSPGRTTSPSFQLSSGFLLSTDAPRTKDTFLRVPHPSAGQVRGMVYTPASAAHRRWRLRPLVLFPWTRYSFPRTPTSELCRWKGNGGRRCGVQSIPASILICFAVLARRTCGLSPSHDGLNCIVFLSYLTFLVTHPWMNPQSIVGRQAKQDTTRTSILHASMHIIPVFAPTP